MGRKIPGKKHRTIKDPDKQRQIRYESIKDKINNPPRNPNDQEIPKSLIHLMQLKSQTKNEVLKKKKKKKRRGGLMCLAKFMGKGPKSKSNETIPNLVQKDFESDTSFLKRVTRMTQNLIDEVEFEKKFGVEIKKDEKTGEVLDVKPIKNKNSKCKKKKLQQKRKEKVLKKKGENDFRDFNHLKDNVEFGEVVHKPPELLILKKGIQTKKHAESKFLSLKLNEVSNTIKSESYRQKPIKSALDKEKNEIERKFIVEAYKKYKNKKKIGLK